MFNQPLDPKTQANKPKLKACIICIDQALSRNRQSSSFIYRELFCWREAFPQASECHLSRLARLEFRRQDLNQQGPGLGNFLKRLAREKPAGASSS